MVWEKPREGDLEALRQQLGRPMRGLHAVAARCVCGAPAVVVTPPRLDDGTPFPTLYYLALPSGTKEASRLEAAGLMPIYEQRLAEDDQARAAYQSAHEGYLHSRERLGVVPKLRGLVPGECPSASNASTRSSPTASPRVPVRTRWGIGR